MEDRIVKKIALTPDEEGNISVRCPECYTQFKTAASNITDDPNSPIITCPACGKELTKVLPAGKEVEDTIERIELEAAEEAKREWERIIKKHF